MSKSIGQRSLIIMIVLTSLVVGLVVGIFVTAYTDLKYIFSSPPQSTQTQPSNNCTQLSILVRRYVYAGLVYDLKTLLVLITDARVGVTIANLTNSIDMLRIAKIDLETAINVTDKMINDLQVIKTLGASQTESSYLDQIRDNLLTTKVSISYYLSDVNNALANNKVPPDLVDKANNLFNNVSQSIDTITAILKQMMS